MTKVTALNYLEKGMTLCGAGKDNRQKLFLDIKGRLVKLTADGLIRIIKDKDNFDFTDYIPSRGIQ